MLELGMKVNENTHKETDSVPGRYDHKSELLKFSILSLDGKH